MLTNKKKYDILSFMRFFSVLILFLFISIAPSFAYDVVQTNNASYKGKITNYSDGLIQIKVKGNEYSIVRSKNKDYYGDYIKYVDQIYNGTTSEMHARISFVDRFTVFVWTKDNIRIKIPRYRIKVMILDAK